MAEIPSVICPACKHPHPANVWCTCPAAEETYRREQRRIREAMNGPNKEQ